MTPISGGAGGCLRREYLAKRKLRARKKLGGKG